MKKTIVSLTATIALVFTGCFIDSDTATVRVNLGNIPVAKVEKKSLIDRFLMIFAKEAVAQEMPGDIIAVHLGAFDSNNQLLAKKSINVSAGEYPADNVVSFDVPARSGVTIVVLGERFIGEIAQINDISHYGKNDVLLNLTAGATETVEIIMSSLDSVYINLTKVEGISRYEWEIITGAKRYNLYDNSSNIIGSTYNNYYDTELGIINLEIEFNITEVKSNWVWYCN